MFKFGVSIIALLVNTVCAEAASYYTARPDDPQAVYLAPGVNGVRGDGAADDSDAIQKAIDQVQETSGLGVVFLAEGRYRLGKTINVWPGIRVFGYGESRPVLVLAPNTPGYQDRSRERYMVFFAGRRPAAGGRGGPAGAPGAPARGGDSDRLPDSGAGTFYSAMSNIDLEIGDGNPGAVGVRGTYAQHSFLAHMDFRIGQGIAGVHDTGNVMEDVRFYGGAYGIWTRTPSPSWQFTAVDAYFEGQREAAIRETAAGLTLVRPHFRKVPTAVSVDSGAHDELWIKDGRLEEISGPAIVLGLENVPRNEINMENVVCRSVPVFASFPSGRRVAGPAGMYEVKVFSHGYHYADLGAAPAMRDIFEASALASMPAPAPSDLTPLPPMSTWVNIRSLGAKGDGKTDDTEVFRKALAAHRAIYLPQGYYIISDTLVLRPDTALIGMHPSTTQIDLLDRTPAFQGVDGPKPMIEAPKGGANIMIGLGVYTNGINPRAVGVKWMSGKDSLMNDVRFHGGHGTPPIGGGRANPYNNNRTADPDASRRWDSQYPSLWVTDGGGGTFFDIWTPSSFAQAGMLITNTATEGRVYEMSSEHHVRYEVQLRNVSNWKFYALQTEEERGEGGYALPLEIDSSSNITVANFHIYRVISSFQPFPWAIKVVNSKDIRFRNIHCYSNSKVSFDAAVYDQTHNVEIRQREFAWLTISGNPPKPAAKKATPVVAAGAKVERLAGGFFNISGGAVHPSGDLFFVDAKWHRIYRWSAAARRLSTVRESPLDPVNLAIDKAGNVMVVSYEGKGIVYAFNPDAANLDVKILPAVAAAPRPGMTPYYPVGDWSFDGGSGSMAPAKRAWHFLSPDGTTYIASGEDFASGALSWGIKSADLVRGFGLAPGIPGKPFYYTTEAQTVTGVGAMGEDGNLQDFKPFVHQGGDGLAVDSEGNVYLADGQISVYSPSGKLIDVIEVAERPTQLVFGGKDGRTLFILARSSLYAVRTKARGR